MNIYISSSPPFTAIKIPRLQFNFYVVLREGDYFYCCCCCFLPGLDSYSHFASKTVKCRSLSLTCRAIVVREFILIFSKNLRKLSQNQRKDKPHPKATLKRSLGWKELWKVLKKKRSGGGKCWGEIVDSLSPDLSQFLLLVSHASVSFQVELSVKEATSSWGFL